MNDTVTTTTISSGGPDYVISLIAFAGALIILLAALVFAVAYKWSKRNSLPHKLVDDHRPFYYRPSSRVFPSKGHIYPLAVSCQNFHKTPLPR
ncbi:m120 protein [Murid betaherpesvirus 1]|nr:m120 protein [Murid betaherpesvirus 1]AWV68376.1 m120 protein [Murid betaherpesvirus 1]